MPPVLLERLLANRAERVAARDANQTRRAEILALAETRSPSALTTDEDAEFRRLIADAGLIDDELRQIDEQLPALRDQAIADATADAARRQIEALTGISTSVVRIKSEPTTYRRGGEFSWFRDMARSADRGTMDERATERLLQHRKEMEVLSAGTELELRVNPNTTDGQGGEFVPPLWLLEMYVPMARAGRVAAELCQKFPLPAGTDSINIPKFATGATVAVQTEGSAASSTDVTTTSVSGHVETFAGQGVITMQLLDQSPVALDQILFQDLIADYAVKLDQQVIYGTGSAPQLRGVTQVSGINATTYTDATPTLPELYPKLIKAATDIGTSRYLPAQAFLMHPRRWGWMLGQLDANNRPLIVPNDQGPQNAFAGLKDVRAEGAVGSVGGLPVYVDPNIPTNLGAGTNEDIVICARWDDLYLFEGQLRTRVLFETDASAMKVRYQMWAYDTFIGGRYPVSISTVGGTGLLAVLS